MLNWLRNLFVTTSKKSIDLTVHCSRSNTSVKMADCVKIWNDGTTSKVKVFELDGDYGFIGMVDSLIVSKHLQNGGSQIAFVQKASRTQLTITVFLDKFERPAEQIQAEINSQRISQLKTPYFPRKPLNAVLFTTSDISFEGSIVVSSNLEEVINDIANIESHLFLIDKDGNRLEVENRTGISISIKFMRAIYSGIHFELLEFKKMGHFYHLSFKPINPRL